MEASRLKPQDALILMKLLVSQEFMQQKDLAAALGLSPAEVSYGLRRLHHSHLLASSGPIKENAIEFLVHGLKYVCPAEFGQDALGIRTSFAHPDFTYVRYEDSAAPVWPHAEGTHRGPSLQPIYKTLPDAALKDPNLYVMASLVEMIRSGRARERELGAKSLAKLIKEGLI